MNDRPAPKGRGSNLTPANRFTQVHIEPDPDLAEEDQRPDPRTRFLLERAASIVTENDSPDIPFRYSINPYRGCEHGCSYCLSPDTPILHADMTWRRIGDARPGDLLVGFDEYPPAGRSRKYRPAVVEAVWWSKKPTLRMTTANTEIVTTADHRWLDARNGRWCRTGTLRPGRTLRYVPVAAADPFDEE